MRYVAMRREYCDQRAIWRIYRLFEYSKVKYIKKTRSGSLSEVPKKRNEKNNAKRRKSFTVCSEYLVEFCELE